MKRFLRLFSIISVLLSMVLVGCKSASTDDDKKQSDSSNVPTSKMVSINDRLFNIPSPFQLSDFMKKSGLRYNKNLLNTSANAIKYNTNFKKSLNLGIYGADMAYLNLNDQLADAARYFAVIKQMANELGIISAIEDKLLKRFDSNKSNKDSILYVIADIYRNSDVYLLNSDRNDVAILILTGGWIESLHFLVQNITTKDQEVLSRIGEQKYPLDNLIELMRPYYNQHSDEFDKLLKDMIELATIFDGVVINYSYQKSTVDVKNKTTFVNCKSKTVITDYQLNTIMKQVEQIRGLIIN